MVVLLRQLLNTPLINGNMLETFKIHDVATEQSQMKIEFMSSVEVEHCKSFHIKSTLSDLFSLSWAINSFIKQN